MSKYIIVKTYCNKKKIANEIIEVLLKKKLVAGAQVSKISSKYWWNNSIEISDEYQLEFRTKKNLFSEIEKEIKKIHDYDVAEISAIEIEDGSKEFFKWIDDNTISSKYSL